MIKTNLSAAFESEKAIRARAEESPTDKVHVVMTMADLDFILTLAAEKRTENRKERKATSDDNYHSGLSFGEAIELVKLGRKLSREGWNGKGQYVELASNISYKRPDGEVVNPEHEAIGNAALAFCGTSGIQLGWLASQADMLAEDWTVIE